PAHRRADLRRRHHRLRRAETARRCLLPLAALRPDEQGAGNRFKLSSLPASVGSAPEILRHADQRRARRSLRRQRSAQRSRPRRAADAADEYVFLKSTESAESSESVESCGVGFDRLARLGRLARLARLYEDRHHLLSELWRQRRRWRRAWA